MKASIHIEVDDDTGETMMTTMGEGDALELANDMIEMAINGGLDDFVGNEIETHTKQ